MHFHVYRDSDTLRLRKMVIELYDEDYQLLDRRRMFGMFGTKFMQRRLARKCARMLKFQAAIAAVTPKP